MKLESTGNSPPPKGMRFVVEFPVLTEKEDPRRRSTHKRRNILTENPLYQLFHSIFLKKRKKNLTRGGPEPWAINKSIFSENQLLLFFYKEKEIPMDLLPTFVIFLVNLTKVFLHVKKKYKMFYKLCQKKKKRRRRRNT